ncbi:MAG: SURF1 family protein [Marinibacterium sp.]
MRRTLFVLFIAVLGTATLCWLGIWQYQRMGWKRDILDQIETRIAADPIDLPDHIDPEVHKYLPVKVDGIIEPGEIGVYSSLKGSGPGYRVIAPLQVGDRRILLDRGFVPLSLYDVLRQTGPATITGNLHWPDEVDGFTPEPDRENRTWFARDVPSIAQALGTEPVMIVAATSTDPNIIAMPVDTTGIPNDHLQYAITWFLLAIVWLGMSIYFLRRNRRRS